MPQFPLRQLACLLLAITGAAGQGFAASVNTTQRSVTRIADGIYVIRHPDAPDQFPQGNTTVVIGDREVLVVDSCYLPSSARQDIAQIRGWTDKPVRYLLNTHWHFDHTMGNGVYADMFPSLAIIAHNQTLASMRGHNPSWFRRYPLRTADLRKQLDTGKNPDGKPLDVNARADIEKTLKGRPEVEAEFAQLRDRLPNLSFDHELTLDLGGREVQVRHFGLGNTAGDALVYLPREKILVTGDLLDYPVPYLAGGYPSEQIGTLRSMAQLDAQTIVPGHGEILHDKVYLNQVIDFLAEVVASVQKQVYRVGFGSSKLEQVRARVMGDVDLDTWRQRFGGDDKDNREFFDEFSLPELITTSYDETWRK